MGKIAQAIVILSGSMAGTFLTEGAAQPSLQGEMAPYRIVQGLTACFCPSDHMNFILSSRAQLDELLETAPCTSRGDGAEERARAWSEGCRRAMSESRLDFEREALVYVGRFFSSGMITGSLVVSGPEHGVLTVDIRRHQPEHGPLTPDLGFFGSALVVDKTRVGQIRTDDGRGNAVVLQVESVAHR